LPNLYWFDQKSNLREYSGSVLAGPRREIAKCPNNMASAF
jgi:hypothetical protein